MGAEGGGDRGEEGMCRSLVPAIGWLTGDTWEDIRIFMGGGMEYAST
jgi:hypothetical protein